jgi:HAD superfamily hydrolase (TIGR01509 family)
VVFDCDGTIADTESLSEQAWTEVLLTHGYHATPADFAALIGRPFPDNWRYFEARVDLGPERRFRGALRSRFVELFDTGLVVFEDAVETVRELVAGGVPVAVASSSNHGHVERVLARAGIAQLVEVVVGADDVTAYKPAPEPYLAAAARLGADPVRCIAVEDTPVGLASCTAAGMFAVGIVRPHMDAAALVPADRIVERISVAGLLGDGVVAAS